MAEPQLARALLLGLLLLREVGLYFAFGHRDAVVHLALPQPLDKHLVPQILAKALERYSVALEYLAELGQRHLVRLRYAAHRAVQIQLIDFERGFLGELQLHSLGDHAFENLALHFRLGRRSRAAPVQFLDRIVDPGLELVLGDYLVVHHSHDAVHHRRLRRLRPAGRHDQPQ